MALPRQDVCNDFTRAEKILALNTPMMNFAVYTVFVVVIQFGSYLIISSKGTLLNVGQFSALTTYGFMILMALMMVSMVFAMIVMAQESAERIVEVIETEPTIENPEHPVTEMVDGSIDFDHVTFKYSEKAEHRALADIDLHIKSRRDPRHHGRHRRGQDLARQPHQPSVRRNRGAA